MILKNIKIKTYIKDPTNCYIIFDEKTKETMVIDPAGEVEKIIEMLDILQAKIKYIVITHCHGDHIGGVNELRNKKGGKILIHRICEKNLNNQEIMLTEYIGMEKIFLQDVRRVDDDDLLHIGDIEFRVIHTPGHTNGGISIYCKEHKMIFTGDTIFRGVWGRTDLPTGSINEIMSSITNKILILPDDTMIYPGHGLPTTVKEEKNIYLKLEPRGF
jgi:glyoxylase-like metal-dependent hydrolase (beta-lactamase superfamily II)